MSTREYKRMFRHIPEIFYNEGNLGVAKEEIAVDCVEHIPMPARYEPGLVGFEQRVRMFRGAMPDLRYSVDHLIDGDLIGEGNKVLHRLLGHGTHKGDFLGIRATGREASWTEIHIGRYEGNKLAEYWGNVDVLGIFQQMGAVPAPASLRESTPPPQPVTGRERGSTSPEQNKALMRRFIEEVWNQGDLQAADEIFHPAATSPSAPQLPAGPAGVRMIATMFRSAFPDFHMNIEDMIAEEDIVVARFTQGGTHQGTFMGAAPTGRQVQFTEIGILRVAGGKVVESWYETDMLGLYQQVGLIP